MTERERPSIDAAPAKELLTPHNVIRVGRETITKSGLITAGQEPDQLTIMRELESVVERELNRHNAQRRGWTPADYMPIDQQTGQILHRVTDPDERPLLSPTAQAAMIVNLLTEDNLPAYHRIIHNNFGPDGPWGTWANQWTAEEDNHAYAIRSFLDLTLAVDPHENESMRMEQMKQGYDVQKDPLHTLVYVTFQELATRVSHRQTGIAAENDIADKMLQRIALDENFHMLFYRNLAAAAFDVAPNQTMQAVRDELIGFEMPGSNIKGFQAKALRIAAGGIYDLRRHYEEVIVPVLKKWRVFERNDISGYGALARDELAAFLSELQVDIGKFEDRRDSGQLGRVITALERRDQR